MRANEFIVEASQFMHSASQKMATGTLTHAVQKAVHDNVQKVVRRLKASGGNISSNQIKQIALDTIKRSLKVDVTDSLIVDTVNTIVSTVSQDPSQTNSPDLKSAYTDLIKKSFQMTRNKPELSELAQAVRKHIQKNESTFDSLDNIKKEEKIASVIQTLKPKLSELQAKKAAKGIFKELTADSDDSDSDTTDTTDSTDTNFSDVDVPGDEIKDKPLPTTFTATVYVPFKEYSETNEETWKHYAKVRGEWEKFLRKPDGTWVHEELTHGEEDTVDSHRSKTYGSKDIRMQFARAYVPRDPEQTTIYRAKPVADE